MSFKDPKAITEAGTETGVKKAKQPAGKLLVGGFLAGAYIAFAGMLAITVSSGMDPELWGTLPSLFTGAAFTLGLILVVIAGSELLTGNMLLLPLAVMRDRITVGMTLRNFALVLIGNLIGSLFVAYFLAVETGVVTQELQLERLAGIAELKGDSESNWQIFLRALGCNWLVCLAVWMALGAESIGSKVLAIFFPILAFVAMGFDHVVANMFFLPAAIFADVPGIGWGDALNNWLFALLGNLVGAAVFVAGAYYFLYGRDDAPMRGPGDMPAATGTSGGAAGGGDGAARQRELVGR